jgi:NADH-quinone oxidoreductase subunit L
MPTASALTTVGPWIVLFGPLVAATLILFFGRYSRAFSAGLAILGVVVSCVLSWAIFFAPEPTTAIRIDWISIPGALTIPIGFVIDGLSKMMLLIVTTIATLVFTYSLGYMAKEEGYWRYFAGLSLFLFSMLGIVLADNFVMMFIFWELVGVSSYILIGHYYSRNSAAEASKQAFLVNRIGDFGFMLGILLFWTATGSVIFSDIEANVASFASTGGLFAAACVLVFCGTIGKSAQMPLHVWLPNSMEGPTPVSSLLHAATMVAAGVYMLARIYPVLALSELGLMIIAWVGAITCLAGGLMATQQSDIKRILAYSTISQLGYMVMGIGVAESRDPAMFHLFTHAIFKCLLFLCSGSVIVGMHHEQDIWKMGALKNKMPITFLCLILGGLALAGCPGFSGYFSKDIIILWGIERMPIIGWIGVITAGLTAFYISRLFFVVFLGPPRSDAAKHAHESPAVMLIPMLILAVGAFAGGYGFVQHFLFGEHVPEPAHPSHLAEYILKGLFVLGVVSAFLLYRRAEKDPINIPFFANRLYIDNLYAKIVRVFQDGTAAILGWADRWVVDLLVVQVPGRLTWACGFLLRFLQLGNIQGYAFFFGAGVVGLIYFLISR